MSTIAELLQTRPPRAWDYTETWASDENPAAGAMFGDDDYWQVNPDPSNRTVFTSSGELNIQLNTGGTQNTYRSPVLGPVVDMTQPGSTIEVEVLDADADAALFLDLSDNLSVGFSFYGTYLETKDATWNTTVTFPHWIRVRTGDDYLMYLDDSTDGVTWTQRASKQASYSQLANTRLQMHYWWFGGDPGVSDNGRVGEVRIDSTPVVGIPIGLGDWRVAVQMLLPADATSRWGVAKWGESKWNGLSWYDLTPFVRGAEWFRGASEFAGRPEVGVLDFTLTNDDRQFSPWNGVSAWNDATVVDADGNVQPGYFAPGSIVRVVAFSPTGQTKPITDGPVTSPIALGSGEAQRIHDWFGDGGDDVLTYDSATREWEIYNPRTNERDAFTFGQVGGIPAWGKFDGTRTQVASFNGGVWWVKDHDALTYTVSYYGLAGDIPLNGADFDGNGSDAIGVYRDPGSWFPGDAASFAWGTTDDVPVWGDWVVAGTTAAGVWRPSNSAWYAPGAPGGLVGFLGVAGDIPVHGDWDGDGLYEMAVFRPSTQEWIVDGASTFVFGTATCTPLVGDWFGDGEWTAAYWENGLLHFPEGAPLYPGYLDPDSPDSWVPQFTGIVESWVDETVGLGADSFVNVTVVETISTLAPIDDNTLPGVVGNDDQPGIRIQRLLDAAEWQYGEVIDAFEIDPFLTSTDYRLQSTDMANNRISEAYLTADSVGGVVRTDRSGASILHNTPETRVSASPIRRGPEKVGLVALSPGYGQTGDFFEVPYVADSVKVANDDEPIVNDVRLTYVGGSQRSDSDNVSRQQYGPRPYQRSDLICKSNALLDHIIAKTLDGRARKPLRLSALQIHSQHQAALVPIISLDVHDTIAVTLPPLPGYQVLANGNTVDSLTHRLTPLNGSAPVWTVDITFGIQDGITITEVLP